MYVHSCHKDISIKNITLERCKCEYIPVSTHTRAKVEHLKHVLKQFHVFQNGLKTVVRREENVFYVILMCTIYDIEKQNGCFELF